MDYDYHLITEKTKSNISLKNKFDNVFPKLLLLFAGITLLIYFVNSHIKNVENKKVKYELEDDAELKIDLKMFKSGDEFRFDDMFWDITVEQVKNLVPYSLLEEPDKPQSFEDYTYYVSEDNYNLYGQTATATFKFLEDQLKEVELDFSSAKKPKALYDSIVEALVDICGDEGELFQNETTGLAGCKWEVGNTMLQVNTDGSQVVISVELK